MRKATLLSVFLVVVAAALLVAQAGYTDAGKRRHRGGHHLVFIQTSETSGNRIIVYKRADNGVLSQIGAYATGGIGGIATPGTESDRLASQGSLVYDARHKLLFAVNAGSDTVSTFRVNGRRLKLRNIVPSGGGFPASIAVSRNLVYVLNSGGPGIVQGFRIRGNRLQPLSGSGRSLGLSNTDPPDFLTSPGQVDFTPDGSKLIVTTKASGSNIDVFQVGSDGRLSATPVVNPSATPVPFAFTFTPSNRLAVGEAGTSSLTTYVVNSDGTLADPRSLTDGQMALCWIVRVRGFYYVTNTGSDNVSGFTIAANGQPSLIGATGVVANTAAGPIDMAVSGTFLYVQTGSGGTLHQYRVSSDGTLVPLGDITGLPVGMEGIAAK
jgi:6-phosphogluconolactonase (cycloisomerase 2 family)